MILVFDGMRKGFVYNGFCLIDFFGIGFCSYGMGLDSILVDE